MFGNTVDFSLYPLDIRDVIGRPLSLFSYPTLPKQWSSNSDPRRLDGKYATNSNVIHTSRRQVMRIPPITNLEFTALLQRARPPVSLSETLVVANSGGPDSTCLLFLLNRYVQEALEKGNATHLRASPRRIVSLSIDHDLQASSSAMAEQAESIAKTLGVEHVTSKLPWGQVGCPPKPGPDDKIEELARDMRQMVLFNQMKRFNANALALGHHADDQVETMLMRMGRGSSQIGLAGMRFCRRWGMGLGGERDDQLYGIGGMRTWMLRPLLTVPKDRILATCDEHNLKYATDPTNFQPQLTIRNSIRHILNRKRSELNIQEEDSIELPAALADQIADIDAAGVNSPIPDLQLGSDIVKLREINQDALAVRSEIDSAVDDIIRKKQLLSPPGTFLISAQDLQDVKSSPVRDSLLYRITRFVSAEPWGSPRAELGRRRTSMQRLQEHLLDLEHIHPNKNTSLCVGSGVLWRQVQICKGIPRTSIDLKDRSPRLWLATRQPPYRKNFTQHNREQSSNGLRLDITSAVHEGLRAWQTDPSLSKVEILFDRRFLVTIHVDVLPDLDPLSSITVEASNSWTLPRVIQTRDGVSSTVHSYILPWVPNTGVRTEGPAKWDIPKPVKSDWITIEFFRPLSAI